MPAALTARARHPIVAAAFVGVPLASLFIFHAPVVTLGVTAAFSLLIVAAAGPVAFVALVAFLSAAVPKAGLIVGGLPLPVMMFLLLGAALMLRLRAPPQDHRGTRLAVLALLWLAYRLMALLLSGGTLRDLAALAGWFGLPLVLFLVGPPLGSLRGLMARTWTRWLEAGILFACGFSLVQQLFGIERTAISGVTLAVGADYSEKPLLFAGGSKIPSTYQNGNILGVITAFFFVISAEHVLRGRGTRRDTLIMAATAVATLLSGSRSAVIGLGVAMAFLTFRSGLRRQTIAILGLFLVVAASTLHLSPALSQRLFGTDASDPALSLRTEVWSRVLDRTPPSELMTGGPVWARPGSSVGQAEGFIGGVQQVGLIGMAMFIGVFWVATSPLHLRRWRLLLLPVAVSLAVDSAYLVFPTLFLPVARMFSPLEPPGSAGEERPAAVAGAVQGEEPRAYPSERSRRLPG